jgi:Protein of unknown function (DUF4199)
MENVEKTNDQSMMARFRASAVKWGLITGIVAVIFTIILYVLDAKLLVSGYASLGIVFTIVLIVLGVREVRTGQEGFISLSEALFAGFFIYVIATLVSTVFQYLLMTVIDPNLPIMMRETVMENTVAMMQKFGAAEEDINKAIEGMDQSQFDITPYRMFINFLWSSAIGIIIAFIIALIMRKKRPVFE